MIVACLALTIALSGAGYAAVTLPRNSVGTAQLKKNAVTAKKIKNGNVIAGKIGLNAVKGPKIANGAVNSAKVENASLTRADVAAAQFLGATVTVRRTDIALPAGPAAGTPGANTSAFATCPPGEKLIGGSVNVADPFDAEVLISRPTTTNVGAGGVPSDGQGFAFWKGTGRARSNDADTLRVFAICTK